MFLEINKNFGLGLYDDLKVSLFYITFIIIVFVVVSTCVNAIVNDRKSKYFDIVMTVFVCSFVLFIVSDINRVYGLGEWCFNVFSDLLNNLDS